MMWVQTQYGTLVNLSLATQITVEQTGEHHEVIAYFSQESQVVDESDMIIIALGPESECEKILKFVSDSLNAVSYQKLEAARNRG